MLRVRPGDSLKNGNIIGAVTGLLVGALTAGIADCSSGSSIDGCPGLRFSFLAFDGDLRGSGARYRRDDSRRTTIYAAPQTSHEASFDRRPRREPDSRHDFLVTGAPAPRP